MSFTDLIKKEEREREFTRYFQKGIHLQEREENGERILIIHDYPIKIIFDADDNIIDIKNDIQHEQIDESSFPMLRSYGGHKYTLSIHQLIQSKETKYFDTSIIGWMAKNESEESYVRIGKNYLSITCIHDNEYVQIGVTLYKYLEEEHFFATDREYELPEDLKGGKLYTSENKTLYTFYFPLQI